MLTSEAQHLEESQRVGRGQAICSGEARADEPVEDDCTISIYCMEWNASEAGSGTWSMLRGERSGFGLSQYCILDLPSYYGRRRFTLLPWCLAYYRKGIRGSINDCGSMRLFSRCFRDGQVS